ncbi:MAG: thiamine phosphate synthase [Planctomycetota bacterium]
MNRSSKGRIPGGVWAIGSDLRGEADLTAFLRSSEGAQALTQRRAGGATAERLWALKRMRTSTGFLAVHGHADLAMAAGADAVIAGVRTLPLRVYRERFPSLLRGASTHDLGEVASARQEGADFLIFGPIWNTPEKLDILEPRGLDRLAQACACGLPVIAIGGIENAEEVQACLRAGAHGVAVLRAARDAKVMQELVTASANGPDA